MPRRGAGCCARLLLLPHRPKHLGRAVQVLAQLGHNLHLCLRATLAAHLPTRANRDQYCYVYALCPLCIRIVICILTDP